MFCEHARTGAGRDDDIIIIRESFDHRPRNFFRKAAVARIVRRLTAAGLHRDFDAAASIFEQFDTRPADGWAKKIDKTGDEQADTWRLRNIHPASIGPAAAASTIEVSMGQEIE